MPRRFTLDSLVTSCKQQVDLENHGVVSAAEWKGFLSRAYGELYTIVFESGLQYFEYSTNLVSTGAAYLAEVSDHLSTVTLTYVVNASTGTYADLVEIAAQERSRVPGGSGDRARFFVFVDDRIYLYPTPPSGQTYELRYVPQPPDLTTFAGSDAVDVVTPDGHDFLIWSVAVRVHGKTEADPGLAIREREAARERFMDSVRLRALTSARRLMVQADDDGYDYP